MSIGTVLDKAAVQVLGGYPSEAVARLKKCGLFMDSQIEKVQEMLRKLKPCHSEVTPLQVKNRMLAVLSSNPSATQVKPSYICFSDTSEFANSYPSEFKVLEGSYPNVTAYICDKIRNFLLKKVCDESNFSAVKELLDRCKTAEEVLFVYCQFNESPKKKHIWENLQAEYIKAKNSGKIDIVSHPLLNVDGFSFEQGVWYVLRQKFNQNLELKEKLLDTGDAYLAYRSYDTTWSDGFDGKGSNLLGKCLMSLRGEYGGSGVVEPNLSYSAMLESSKMECNGYVQELMGEMIFELFQRCVANRDFSSLSYLSYTNKHFFEQITKHAKSLVLSKYCTNMRIFDAELLGLIGGNEPPVRVLATIRSYLEMERNVESGAGLTLLTTPQGGTLNQLVAMAQEAGIKVSFSWKRILRELGDVPIPQTSRVMISNSVFLNTRDKYRREQREAVHQLGCQMQTLQESLAVCIYTKTISGNERLYGNDRIQYGRTSTKIGKHYVYFGCLPGDRIIVGIARGRLWSNGAGGKRTFI